MPTKNILIFQQVIDTPTNLSQKFGDIYSKATAGKQRDVDTTKPNGNLAMVDAQAYPPYKNLIIVGWGKTRVQRASHPNTPISRHRQKPNQFARYGYC